MSPMESRCCICDNLFTPNKYSGSRQKVCDQPACRIAAKRRRQALWIERNPDYFRGPEHVERVRQWRLDNPDRARRRRPQRAKSTKKAKSCNTISQPGGVLQDSDSVLKSPIFLGLLSLVTGSVLQDEVHSTIASLSRIGLELQRSDAAASETSPNLNAA